MLRVSTVTSPVNLKPHPGTFPGEVPTQKPELGETPKVPVNGSLGEIPSVETRTKGPVKLTPKFPQWKCAYCVLIAGLLHTRYADSRSHFIKHATSLCCQGPRDSKWWMSAMRQQNKSNLKKQLVVRSVEWRLSLLPPLSSVVVLYTQGVECKQWREVRDRRRLSVPTTHFDQMSRVPIMWSRRTLLISPSRQRLFFCQRSTSLAAVSHWALIRAGSIGNYRLECPSGTIIHPVISMKRLREESRQKLQHELKYHSGLDVTDKIKALRD